MNEWTQREHRRVDECEAEAKRFLKRVAAWRKAQKDYPGQFPNTPAESGAMKRASMDLSRSLAVLRKGDQAR